MISATTPEASVTQYPDQLKKPYTQLLNVTPELAARWLQDTNINNRRLRAGHAEKIARDIRSGQWLVIHQGIAFSKDGVLLDGQHRLQAVVLAGTAVQMNVSFNQPAEALKVIDRHVSRNDADALNLTGACGKVCEAEISTLRAMVTGIGPDLSLTPAETQKAMLQHKDAIRFAHQHLPSTRRKGVGSSTTRAVVARAFYSADLERLALFCKILCTGIATSEDDQAAAFIYQFLANAPRKGVSQRKDVYAKLERALFAFMLFERMNRLCGTTRELFPLPAETKR